MSSLLVLLLMAAACLLLGYVLVRAFDRPGSSFSEDWLAYLFACLILGLTVAGWFAFVLAELGWFAIGVVGLFWLSLLALGLLLLWRRGGLRRLLEKPGWIAAPGDERRPRTRLPAWLQWIALAIWLVAALWLYLRPHEFILGAADAGVYVNLAANIERTGGIVEVDDTLAQLDPAMKQLFLRPLPESGRDAEIAPTYLFPAFYVTDEAAGEVTPQFYHLHPVWQAIAYALGGVRANLLMTGFWALLASLALYLVMRQIAGWEAAVLGLAGLTINALQVWFARYPTTEMLTQFLLWSALWSMMLWVQGGRPRWLWALLGGLALGEVFLVRIDAYFLLVIPAVIWLWLRWSGRWQREDWLFFIPLAGLTIHSLLHAFLFSAPYFYLVFGLGLNLLQRNPALPVGVIVLGIVVLLLIGRTRNRLAGLARYKRPLAWAAVTLVLGLAAYAWFLRPQLGDVFTYDYWYGGGQVPTGLDRENLIRLGWYLSPLGIGLAVTSICLMVLKLNRQTALVLAAGLIFSLLYLWRIQANPHQVYTMRRYMPAVLPFAMVATAYLFGYLFGRKERWLRLLALLAAVLWLVALVRLAPPFIRQVDYQGITVQLSDFNSQFETESVIIFNDQAPVSTGDKLGTPMRYLFGHDVYTLRDLEGLDLRSLERTLEAWLASGRAVYWVGPLELLAPLDMPVGETFTSEIRVSALEGRYDSKPEALVENLWMLEVTRLQNSWPAPEPTEE